MIATSCENYDNSPTGEALLGFSPENVFDDAPLLVKEEKADELPLVASDSLEPITSINDTVEDEQHNLGFDGQEQEELDNQEEDFFAENKEEGELPNYMQDQYLEKFQAQMDANLSPNDFEKSQFEVYGISRPDEEDPETVAKALSDLDIAISKIKDTRVGEAYRVAEEQSKEFVADKAFRMMFLRCEEFNPTTAARKLMHFFDLKRGLWGEKRLTKRITVEDFDENDCATLEHGHVQLLPARDHAGRAIIFNNLNRLKYTDPMNQVCLMGRICW